jgi:hypothetical protein
MNHQECNVAVNTKISKTAFDKAEALITGVGTGISRIHYMRGAAKLTDDNAGISNIIFPGCHDHP